MEKEYRCADMDPDFADCEFTASGPEEIVLEQAKEHLLTMHGFEEEDITPEVEEKIMTAMTEEDDSIPPGEMEQI